MPIKPENRSRYPENWPEIRAKILRRAKNKCEWPACGLENGSTNPRTGSKVVLTVAHLDHTPENCSPDNLRAWCQEHHLAYDQKHHLQTAYQTRRKEKAAGDLFENVHSNGKANE